MKEKNIILLISLTIFSNSEATVSDNNNKITIWKCCRWNQVIKDDPMNCTTATNIEIPNITVYSSDLVPNSHNLLQYFNVLDSKVVDTNVTEKYNDLEKIGFKQYVMEDGRLHFEYHNVLSDNTDKFCFDYKIDGAVLTPIFLTENEDDEPEEIMTGITTGVMLMSCFFLFLVLVVYLILEETRNLIGLTIIAYVFCFLNGLLVLAINRTAATTRLTCKVTTYYVYFFLLATFFWMNVISYDIWSMSRSYIQSHTRNRRRKWVQFMRYAAYAVGVPTVLTILLFVLDNVDMSSVPWFVTPGLEEAPCFFNGKPRFIYLYIPILLLILCNTVFYILTGYSLRRHYKETSMLKHSGDSGVTRRQRQRLWMFIKLSIVMGVNWVFEVISAVVPSWTGWYVTDIFNLLVGVSIFVIFVCKKKTIRKLRIKLLCINLYEIQGRKNRNDSYTISSHEVSLHTSPNAEGQSQNFNTVTL